MPSAGSKPNPLTAYVSRNTTATYTTELELGVSLPAATVAQVQHEEKAPARIQAESNNNGTLLRHLSLSWIQHLLNDKVGGCLSGSLDPAQPGIQSLCHSSEAVDAPLSVLNFPT